MKKVLVLAAAAMMALSGTAFAAGLVGDCFNCHTMHNSEQGQPVAKVGTNGTVSSVPVQNLLKFDCVACHAQDPTGGTKTATVGDSVVPQVMHGAIGDDLAGGNFQNGVGANRKAHQVRDLFASGDDSFGGAGVYAEPPGLPHSSERKVFSSAAGTANNFDMFTCAGARGCHGTRSQLLELGYDDNGDMNVYNSESSVRRTGIAAVSGAHHINSHDQQATSIGYNSAQVHSGQMVADGYRFIPGLKGLENPGTAWENATATDHNEYFGAEGGIGGGCGICHIEGNATGSYYNDDTILASDGTEVAGLSSRAMYDSTLKVPNNSMSGFCSSCHGVFHSGGTGSAEQADADKGYGEETQGSNGVSGAFLRHPSDYVINAAGIGGDYTAYTSYDLTAPVARDSVVAAASDVVDPNADMVMCLSCHQPHGTQHDYLLRFDYTATTSMEAGTGSTEAAGGCMACHRSKGIVR